MSVFICEASRDVQIVAKVHDARSFLYKLRIYLALYCQRLKDTESKLTPNRLLLASMFMFTKNK